MYMRHIIKKIDKKTAKSIWFKMNEITFMFNKFLRKTKSKSRKCHTSNPESDPLIAGMGLTGCVVGYLYGSVDAHKLSDSDAFLNTCTLSVLGGTIGGVMACGFINVPGITSGVIIISAIIILVYIHKSKKK